MSNNIKKSLTLLVCLIISLSAFFSFNCYAQETDSRTIIENIVKPFGNTQNNQIKVKYSPLNENGEIIVALYNETILVEMNTSSVTVGQTESILDFSSSSLTTATSVSAFIWDSLSGLTAVSDMKNVTLPLQEEIIEAGTVKFNYKRNTSGEQLFLYKFGTSGDNVEISISQDSGFKMSDLTLSAVPQNGNAVSDGDIMTVVSFTDYTADIRFTGNFLGIININSYLTGTDIIQDTMEIEILDGYSNIASGSGLGGNETNFCLVPTVSNNGVFTNTFSLSENATGYGNDCTVDASLNTSLSEITTAHFVLGNNSTLENIRLIAPYVDKVYGESEVNENEYYKLMSTVHLNEGAKIKNSYVMHGAYVLDVFGDNVTLEDVTVSCGVVPVNLKDGNTLELRGDIIIDNNTKTGDCTTHSKGCAIAVFNSQASTYVNINGNLHVYGFVNVLEVSDFPVSLPLTSEYINPIVVLEGTGSLVVNISEQSNLYGITTCTEFNDGEIFTYDDEAVALNNVDLSYLSGMPGIYASTVGDTTVRYTVSGLSNSYDVYVNGETVVDFSDIKFEKYKDELDYGIMAFKTYVEEENTTVYEYMENCFDETEKEFYVPDEISLPSQIYVIFDVYDIYDDAVYSDYSTYLNCIEDNIGPMLIFTQLSGAGYGTSDSRTIWPCGSYWWQRTIYCYKLDAMYGFEYYASDGSTDDFTITTSWVSQNGGPRDSVIEKNGHVYIASNNNYDSSTSKGHVFRYNATDKNGRITTALRYYTFPSVTPCDGADYSPQPASLGDKKIGYEKAKEFIQNGQLTGTYNGLDYCIIPGTVSEQ